MNQKVTGNITIPNKSTEILKKNFSHCFNKNGEFDIEKFKNEISENEIDFSKESYGLDWLGKSYARLLATDEATTILSEDKDHNKKPENKDSENLLLKGDNLEVLKHLSNAYQEKIKMIYIDPPYNTGSDGFVYEDDRKFTASELQNLAGIDEEKAKRILEFTQSNSNSHSAWLTFMYPRLYIAKQLLKDDGVIFVSIDDNEVAQLRLLMDEIFGEDNYLKEISWNSTKSVTNTAIVSDNHSHVLIYANNISWFIKNRTSFRLDEDDIDGFSNPDDDQRGPWKADPFQVGGWRPNQQYEIKNPSTGQIFTPNEGNSWKNDLDKFKELIEDKRIIFGSTGEGGPQRKRFLSEAMERGKVAKSLWDKSGTTTNGTQEVKKLFDNKQIFTNPKPVKLLNKILNLSTRKDKNALILDFFAGSGTTADAVMQLNAGDDGNRKFILAQLPEKIDQKTSKVAYNFVKNDLKIAEPTIFDITKERIIRSAEKIQNDNSALDEPKNLSDQDFGFKIFETQSIWEDYNNEIDELDAQAKLFDESKLTTNDLEKLLVTWKTYDGVVLTQDLQEYDLGGYTGYLANGKLYLVDKGFNIENLKNLLEKIDSDNEFNPTSIIVFGYHFESKNLREISENIKTYVNKKNIDIDFITRY
jgi:adenine-specific DNA-methyltransferase